MEKEQVYTAKEVAGILKVDVHKVYDLIRKGMLPALKLGSIKVRSSSLEKFLEDYDGKDLTDLNHVVALNL